MTSSSISPAVMQKLTNTMPPEPQYGDYSRFEIELEFVQMLGNPFYLNWLAQQKYLEQNEFIAYLSYLQYFQQPEYVKFLQYPGPTLRSLELLQQDQFRKDILNPELMGQYAESTLTNITK